MNDELAAEQLAAIIRADDWRMEALRAVHSLHSGPYFLAAGFVRNAVWDYRHDLTTPLNDIDVVFFDRARPASGNAVLQEQLNRLAPTFPWEVKNQAHMHHHHQHAAYSSLNHALSYWAEYETAIALRLTHNDSFDIIAPFGLMPLFNNTITPNPAAAPGACEARAKSKGWLTRWPKLHLVVSD